MGKFFASKNMGIDLGTANTLIYVKEQGVILNEPSVIAFDSDRGNILAVGTEAKQMLGKAPSRITVVRPLMDGVISDFDKTVAMLETFLKKALSTNKANNFRVVVGVPSGVTGVEKRAVESVLVKMGAREVFILDEPMAAAIGAGMDVDSSTGCMIADIGGGTTDIAVIALGGVVASSSIRYAGDKFNEAVIQYMRTKHAMVVGEITAEAIKIKLGCAQVDKDENGNEIIETMKARGREIISGLPKTIEITNLDICEALKESMEIIVEGIKSTIEVTPAEIAADIAEQGMYIAGGGAMIKNLDKYITKKTGMKVTCAENPYEAVVMGTGMSLNDIEKLLLYARSIKKR